MVEEWFSKKNRSQFWATASTPCIAPHTSWETILESTASSTDRCDEGSQSHHGFQHKNALMSLMTWMIWGTPILGTPPYRNSMDYSSSLQVNQPKKREWHGSFFGLRLPLGIQWAFPQGPGAAKQPGSPTSSMVLSWDLQSIGFVLGKLSGGNPSAKYS